MWSFKCSNYIVSRCAHITQCEIILKWEWNTKKKKYKMPIFIWIKQPYLYRACHTYLLRNPLCSYVRESLDAWSPIRTLPVNNIKCVTHKQRKRFAAIHSSIWVQKFATVHRIYRVYANELRIKRWMSIQTAKVFHNSEFIFEMKLISFAFVQVIQLRAVFTVVIAKHKNSSLRRKPYNYRHNIVYHGAFQEILRNIVFLLRRGTSLLFLE